MLLDFYLTMLTLIKLKFDCLGNHGNNQDANFTLPCSRINEV